MTTTDRLAVPCGYCATTDIHTDDCHASRKDRPMTASTPVPPREGPHGLAYAVNPHDPTQADRMRNAAFATLEHGPKAWAYVTETVAEALADTPWTEVRVEMTGGGVWTMYATHPDADIVDLDHDYLVAGPFNSDPDYWDHAEASVDWQRNWEDDGVNFPETAFPHPERFHVDGDEDDLRLTDLTEYATQLADAFKRVADARLHGRTARLIGTPQDLDAARKLLTTVQAYLPANYQATLSWNDAGEREIRIFGIDVAGWTLDGYVVPRLASGLYWAEEVTGE